MLSLAPKCVSAQDVAASAGPASTTVNPIPVGLVYDEYGNVIVKQRVFSEKELAAMQAVYPQNMLFTQENIKNGGSILFLFGKKTLSLKLMCRDYLLLLRDPAGHAELHQPSHRHHQEEGPARCRAHERLFTRDVQLPCRVVHYRELYFLRRFRHRYLDCGAAGRLLWPDQPR